MFAGLVGTTIGQTVITYLFGYAIAKSAFNKSLELKKQLEVLAFAAVLNFCVIWLINDTGISVSIPKYLFELFAGIAAVIGFITLIHWHATPEASAIDIIPPGQASISEEDEKVDSFLRENWKYLLDRLLFVATVALLSWQLNNLQNSISSLQIDAGNFESINGSLSNINDTLGSLVRVTSFKQ